MLIEESRYEVQFVFCISLINIKRSTVDNIIDKRENVENVVRPVLENLLNDEDVELVVEEKTRPEAQPTSEE